MKRLRQQQGFSLVEVLIAVGLLAISVAGFLGVVGTAYTEQVRNEDRLRAAWLANNKMTEVLANLQADAEKGVFPEEKKETGSFESPDDAFEFEYAFRKVELPLKDMLQNLTGGALDSQGDSEDASSDGSAASQLTQQLKNQAGQLDMMSKDVSKAVREIKVTVKWKDVETEEDATITLVTHFVNMKVL